MDVYGRSNLAVVGHQTSVLEISLSLRYPKAVQSGHLAVEIVCKLQEMGALYKSRVGPGQFNVLDLLTL